MAAHPVNVDVLPWHLLAASAKVDVLHLAAGIRPAIRLTSVRGQIDARNALQRWGHANNVDVASDDEFTWLSKTSDAEALLALDRRASCHEIELGAALGYPTCCCSQIAVVGEANIDDWAENVQRRHLPTGFDLCNISGYLDGHALLSHIPCTATCGPSLEMARKAARWIRESDPAAPDASPWPTWRNTLCTLSAPDL